MGIQRPEIIKCVWKKVRNLQCMRHLDWDIKNDLEDHQEVV